MLHIGKRLLGLHAWSFEPSCMPLLYWTSTFITVGGRLVGHRGQEEAIPEVRDRQVKEVARWSAWLGLLGFFAGGP